MLELGDRVDGFSLEEKIGEGGMAVVFRVFRHHPHSGPQVRALKTLSPEFDRGDRDHLYERFCREMETNGVLEKAPHILVVYEAGETDRGEPWLQMQHAAGGSLEDLARREGTIDPVLAVEIVRQAALALDYAHERGVIHRDVKPSNILIGEATAKRVQAYLSDWGLAKSVSYELSVTPGGGFVGTPAYCAPEQFYDSDVDGRADIYGLGCTLYRSLTGEVPFPHAHGREAQQHAHEFEPVPSVSAANPSVPPALDDVIWRALAKDPEDRYASALDFAEAALSALNPSVESKGGWRTVASLVAALAVVGLAGALVLGAKDRPKPPPPDRKSASEAKPLTGDLNIAVASFSPTASKTPLRGFDQSVASALEDDLRAAEKEGLDVQIRPPSVTGSIGGDTGERAKTASTLGATSGADVVVYGSVQSDQAQTTFAPEFFIVPSKLPGAEELGGRYALGGPLTVAGDAATNPVSRANLRRQVVARVRALSELMIGLGYFQAGQEREAILKFRAARSRTSWRPAERALVSTLLGNAEGRRGRLPEAERQYRRALTEASGYARARYGLAEVLFQRSAGECASGRASAAGLRGARRNFMSASLAMSQPRAVGATLTTKVVFGVARVDFCLSEAGLGGSETAAGNRFRTVVDSYREGLVQVRDEAAESHGFLGILALPQVDAPSPGPAFEAAERRFGQAARLSRIRDRKAHFYALVAFARERLDDHEGAAAAYRAAARYETDERQRRLHRRREREQRHQ